MHKAVGVGEVDLLGDTNKSGLEGTSPESDMGGREHSH